ncbi:MAG: holliday junction helicase RuvA [Patescibacteria group bacterium]|nr:holliday junction helicase RuvA [Patescibacteria group bacterium]
MIGYLKGIVVHQDIRSVILDVHGVGYKVFTNTTLLDAQTTQPIEFWTYLSVRENALDLYGFQNREELLFFELLISVSGIGPKSALGILSVATLPNLRHAISTGDTSHLTKVSGIGRKNAEKIVLELKDKIGEWTVENSTSASGEIDALEALKSLGYGEREVREALKKVSDISDTGDKIKAVLKLLS